MARRSRNGLGSEPPSPSLSSLRRLALVFAIALSGCAPPVETGDEDVDELVNMIVRREAPFHGCVEIGPDSAIIEYRADDMAAPSTLHVGRFEDPRLVRAARKVSITPEQASDEDYSSNRMLIYGKPETIDGTNSCTMRVLTPIFSGDFSFAEFSTPGGVVGAYAFEKRSGRWHVVERIFLAYW